MKLVIGASGFLGSHVTRQLVAQGDDVRVMMRRTSSTKGIDDLDVERCYGDIFDDTALRAAMTGCDVVYYCVVDARMWLRDPAPLFRTNVEGLRHVLDAAVDARLRRFVFTSTTGTLAISDSTLVTEDDPHNWTQGGAYITSRVAAENLVMQYAREKALPAVALCISTTYGPGDWQPTPHGSLIARVAHGKFPFYLDFSSEAVGIEDAARAMLLAAERGRVGQRYIISDRYLSTREVHRIAATAVGRRPPRIKTSAGAPLCRRAPQRPRRPNAAPRPAVRRRRRAHGRVNVTARPQQGHPRTRLEPRACRRIHPQGSQILHHHRPASHQPTRRSLGCSTGQSSDS